MKRNKCKACWNDSHGISPRIALEHTCSPKNLLNKLARRYYNQIKKQLNIKDNNKYYE